jgi:Flp pilus assembly protein TadG
VVETAIILPILILLMIGLLSFGTWFMAAHGVQLAANEAARAALGGINDSDRTQLAREGVASALTTAAAINPTEVATATSRDGQYYTVTVTYAPAHPLWLSFGSGPAPSKTIERKATVRLTAL